MKATELKIGDKVINKLNSQVVTVTEISPLGIRCFGKYKRHYIIYLEDAEPIPLTKEILEKNGWKPNISANYVYIALGGFACYELWLCRSGIWRMYWNGREFDTVDILYVHQLQHLLWALNLEEDITV